jgi:hypothetical protein
MSCRPQGAFAPEFSPDGRFLRTENSSFSLWALPPSASEDTSPPEWLLQLATLCAGTMVNHAGELVGATDEIPRIDTLRRQILTLPAGATFAEWGRWLLDNRVERPIAPGFTVSRREAEALLTSLASAPPAGP